MMLRAQSSPEEIIHICFIGAQIFANIYVYKHMYFIPNNSDLVD